MFDTVKQGKFNNIFVFVSGSASLLGTGLNYRCGAKAVMEEVTQLAQLDEQLYKVSSTISSDTSPMPNSISGVVRSYSR